MNDTMREYCSYGKLILPILQYRRTIVPHVCRWGEHKDQYFLYFEAPQKKENKLVVYINGGGWRSYSPREHDFVGQTIAAQGYDCVMLGYRKAPKFHYEQIRDDVFAGYVKMRSVLKEHGHTYDKTVAMGSSAGGHLAAVLCFDEETKEKFGIAKDEFAGLLSMAGPMSFEREHVRTVDHLVRDLFGSSDHEDWKKGEPILMISNIPGFKVRMVQSKHDGLVGYEQACDFYEKALSLGMDAKFYEVTDPWNTHSAYCVGVFLLSPEKSNTLRTALEMIAEI